MKPKIFIVLFLSFLSLLLVPAWAEEIKTNSEQSAFTLEVTDNLINLQAEERICFCTIALLLYGTE